jgi:hypothetical protein
VVVAASPRWRGSWAISEKHGRLNASGGAVDKGSRTYVIWVGSLDPKAPNDSQAIALQTCYFWDVKELPITERIRLPRPRVGVAVLGLTLLSSLAFASDDYCTKEQYERDHAFIESAINAGMLVGPKSLHDSILVHEGMWLDMNYPEQIVFMQRFECAMGGAGGKHLLSMDVRSLGTDKLLATWFFGQLKPAEERPDLTNPGMSEGMEDKRRIGLSGEARANFIKGATEECNKSANSASATFCSCYAKAIADSVSINELEQTKESGWTTLRPKIEAAATRCWTN